jgi:hypothetical protein
MRALNIAALCFLVASGVEAQTLPSLYGIQLGEPLAVPECEMHQSIGGWRQVGAIRAQCFERGSNGAPGSPPPSEGFVFVHWPALAGPQITKERVSVSLLDGVVQRIEVFTSGEPVQELAMEQLHAKFGRPSNSSTVPMQNRLGARFEALSANWNLSDGVAVQFIGIGGILDRGSLVLATKAGREAHEARVRKALPARPGM